MRSLISVAIALVSILGEIEFDRDNSALTRHGLNGLRTIEQAHTFGNADQAKSALTRRALIIFAGRETAPVVQHSDPQIVCLALNHHVGRSRLRMPHDVVVALLQDAIKADFSLWRQES